MGGAAASFGQCGRSPPAHAPITRSLAIGNYKRICTSEPSAIFPFRGAQTNYRAEPIVYLTALNYQCGRCGLIPVKYRLDPRLAQNQIGLKPILHKVWTLSTFTGRRPTASVGHRYDWRYLAGFVHPASGRTVWHLAMPVHIERFCVELDAFAREVGASPAKEIVLMLDAGGPPCQPPGACP